MVDLEQDIWYWYHNISECYYHIQLTIKYRKSLVNSKTEGILLETVKGIEERYAIGIQTIGFDKNHVHILCRFLPKYSEGQVIRLIKSIISREIFKQAAEVRKSLWGGEFWTDGYYIATISGKGDKRIIENYIKNQGRVEDIKQLKLFDL